MTVLGLPLPPLIVHATVVAVPAAASAVLLSTCWPRFRRWESWGPAALAAVAMVLVPRTTSSGESPEHTLPRTALLEARAHLADGLLPRVVALLVGALLVLWPQVAGRGRPGRAQRRGRGLVDERVRRGILCGWGLQGR
jgi:hypothetical protein